MTIESRLEVAKASPRSFGLRGYAAVALGSDRVNDFKAWAFGLEADEMPEYQEIPKLWNGKNIRLMEVKGTDNTMESFDKMLMLYEANIEKLSR